MIIASFEYEFNSKKSKLLNPYMVELTVFIKVKIPSLKELSKLIPNIERSDEIVNNEITNIKTDKKYLLISLCSIFISIKWNLLVKILFGFE